MSLGFFESAVGELPLVGRVHGGANTHLSGTRNERLLAFALFLPRERFCFVQRLCYTTFAGLFCGTTTVQEQTLTSSGTTRRI